MRLGQDLALLLSAQAAQVPLMSDQMPLSNDGTTQGGLLDFAFKTGADTFSPVDLVTLPRPGSALVSPDGELIVVPVSTYDLKASKNNKTIWIASTASNINPFEVPLARGGDAFWLDARTLAHVVRPSDEAPPQIYARNVEYSTETTSFAVQEPYVVGDFPDADVTNFQVSPDGSWIVFSADVYHDRDLTTVKKQDNDWANRGTSALVYESTFVRHWDTYRTPKRSSLFSVKLTKGDDGKYTLGKTFNSILKDTDHHTPVEPFGGTDNFDASNTHVVYTTKDPSVQPAWHTRQNIYLVPVEGGEPVHLTSGSQGATANPVFNTDGSKIAWIELAKDGNEADKGQIVVHDLKDDVQFQLAEQWDLSPGQILFSHDNSQLFLVGGEDARNRIFTLPIPPTPSLEMYTDSRKRHSIERNVKPTRITSLHYSSAVQRAGSDGTLVLTQSSMKGPNNAFLLVPHGSPKSSAFANRAFNPIAGAYEVGAEAVDIKYTIHQLTDFALKTLGPKNLDKGVDFWFPGAHGHKVQGFIVKPPGFNKDDKKKWPVILLIHGGPQSAWEDNWSTRWNPNIFAQQGYVVVAINPTGSTTFGQAFTDAISGDWGGRPFEDLRKGWSYLKKNWPQIDFDRAVAAGASWGGYAINWIAGHPEWDFHFKALFCHDGVFDTLYMGLVTEELYFFENEFHAPPYTKKGHATAEKFNPARLLHKWKTPMLIVHGSKDYRLPDTEGISAFHAMQRQGIKSRLVLFPDENHWVLNHKNSLKWHWEVLRWFDQHVGAGPKESN